MAGMSDMRLSALDPQTGLVEVMGSFLDESCYSTESGAHPYIGCMGFDRFGELWACVCTVRKKGAERCRAGDVVLYRREGAPYVLHRIV